MKKHICFIVTAAISAEKFLTGFLPALHAAGFRVTLITSDSPKLRELARQPHVEFIPIEMQRTISPIADAVACFRLWRVLRKIRPDLINAGTPKAGLLGSIAAWLARVPVRIFQQRGLRLETTSGLQRKILFITEKVSAACATHIVCNSLSLRQTYEKLNLASADKMYVLGGGSSNGVDIERYHPTRYVAQAATLRQQLGLNEDWPVIGFFGRLTRDKGIEELLAAFKSLTPRERYLLLVGPLESGDPISDVARQQIATDERIIATGYLDDLAPYYQLLDILAFPSHREGFPNVPLEAAASGVPTVGFDVTGTRDAVIHGETGILVPAGDVTALEMALKKMLTDVTSRSKLGQQARQRVVAEYDSRLVRQQWVNFYQACLDE